MEINADRIRNNVRQATSEDLLDRVTVYRREMEPAALPIIEAELASRGISLEEIETHLVARRESLARSDGSVVKCMSCHRPAVVKGWGWHKIFGMIAVFPRRFAWCAEHRPATR